MPNRAGDWLSQAERDLEQARDSGRAARHEWACFAAQQAAEKAATALHLHLGQEAWGHVVARLLQELPDAVGVPGALIEKGRVLDNFYIPARYPNSHPEGAPFEHYGPLQSDEASAMPVRSLRSSVLKWPDARAVEDGLRAWVTRLVASHPEVCRVGYFGSYARGDWGVGSDVDLIVVVDRSDAPFERRAVKWDTSTLPVPADVLVYTDAEWQAMLRAGRPSDKITWETIWLHERASLPSAPEPPAPPAP